MVESLNSTLTIKIHHCDFLKTNLGELSWLEHGPLLVVGNPPWITNSELGALKSNNVPSKSNIKRLRGIDALTGEANFDIAEYVWIKLIKELAWARPTIALLCKTTVARNVLRFASDTRLPISGAAIYRIDAKRWFDAAADACLFRLEAGGSECSYAAKVYSSLEALEPETVLSIVNGSLIANAEAYRKFSFFDGQCFLEWRQGLKHDLAAIMELTEASGALRNKRDEIVEIENDFVYPLLKSSDLHGQDDPLPRYRVIITQKHLGDETSDLAGKAPRLWSYLNRHLQAFRSRQSSIYQGRPDFAIFGIGDYSFSSFKLAVSGLYKNIRFRVLRPFDGKPVMLDDTCYFVQCESLQQACALAQLLNHDVTLTFLDSVVFKDSKRPLTKRVLQRLDIEAILNHVDMGELLSKTNLQLEGFGAQLINNAADVKQLMHVSEQPYQQFRLL